jgi:hypothetical protein
VKLGPSSLSAAAALAVFAGCGQPPATRDDVGVLTVPASYHQASITGGHLAHVGTRLADGGTIACRNCHDVDVKGLGEPGLESCKTCHEDPSGFRHGVDAGLADAGQVTCVSCHPFWVRKGDQPLTPWVCLDCHRRPQGTKRNVEIHDAACFFCHRPHRAPFTRPPDCVVCHQVGLVHGAKGDTVAQTCMKCHEQHRPAAEATRECVACHTPAELQGLHAEKKHQACADCHAAHTRKPGSQRAVCLSCHKEQVNHEPKAERCTGCHLFEAPKNAPVQPKK